MAARSGGERSPELNLIWTRPERPAREPALSRARIVRAAIEMADAEGLRGVSMRRIAVALGVGAMSLYYYVPTKEDVLDLMLDAALGDIELPERPSGDWRADLRTIGEQTRGALRHHPWLAALIYRPRLGPNALRQIEFSLAALDGLGLDITAMLGMIATLDDYVNGFAVREQAWRRSGLTEEEWHAAVAPYVRRVIAGGRYPRFARVIEDAADLDADASFAFGLDCLLDGIAARVANARGGQDGQQPRR